MKRRNFLKGAGALMVGGVLPISLVEVAFGKEQAGELSPSPISRIPISSRSRAMSSCATSTVA